MRIPYNWLKEYIDFDLSPAELADALTMTGTEVTAMEGVGASYDNVVVGLVVSKRKHPNAGQLSICQVDVGSGLLDVVCGAPNVAEGQKVPVALVGARLPNGLEVRKAKLRGEPSEAMICSEVELGLGEDASGIMALDEKLSQGTPLAEALDLGDVVLELDITLNRPDCMSLIGVAREVRAITHQPLRLPDVAMHEGEQEARQLASVSIEDADGCPRYAARVITGVTVQASPPWMQRRLELCGLRPINNVVDITNYVLLEMGHPLHAFDLETLADHHILVRRARDGESFTTLDGVERNLSEEVLMIADPKKAVAVAGVMGGQNAEVSQKTTNLLIESAYFSPTRVRRGSRVLDLSTEASVRFERGADPEGNVPALDRACALIAELAGGTVARGVIDEYPGKQPQTIIEFRPERAQAVLGEDIGSPMALTILSELGCNVQADGVWKVSVPTFRPDLQREIDLVEELARIYGYSNIQSREIAAGPLFVKVEPQQRLSRTTREILTSLGLSEAVTNTLVSPEMEAAIGADPSVLAVQNPSNREMSVLRSSLLPSLLDVARWNLNRQAETIRIFEIGKVFSKASDGAIAERLQVVGLLAERTHHRYQDEQPWRSDFFQLKGIVEAYLSRISLDKCSMVDYDDAVYDAQQSAAILLSEDKVGHIGKVRRSLLGQFDIAEGVYYFALDPEALLPHFARERAYSQLPRFPAVERDIAVVVNDDTPSQQVADAMLGVDRRKIESARLFDVYRGKQIPEGKKSLAFALRFRSMAETLTEEHVNELQRALVNELSRRFSAVLRE